MSGPLRKIQGKQIKPNFTETVTAPIVEAELKYFRVKHPNKKGYSLVHSCLEGPENGIYIRGKSNTKKINLPDYFVNFVDYNSITVNITCYGSYNSLYVQKIDKELNCVFLNELHKTKNNYFDCEYFYVIFAERIDFPKLEIVQIINKKIPERKSIWNLFVRSFNSWFKI
jgi:hypothetical protein